MWLSASGAPSKPGYLVSRVIREPESVGTTGTTDGALLLTTNELTTRSAAPRPTGILGGKLD
ncbi:unnamed protein product [Echinostoma caproni]|uniref:Uncharacterized protein n=1 Tax=Echinostoma caproni TaxID=27848 RepID=A0A3P8IHD8_9TREM|nr:unnamed protein product [Echinostoma caproni]